MGVLPSEQQRRNIAKKSDEDSDEEMRHITFATPCNVAKFRIKVYPNVFYDSFYIQEGPPTGTLGPSVICPDVNLLLCLSCYGRVKMCICYRDIIIIMERTVIKLNKI